MRFMKTGLRCLCGRGRWGLGLLLLAVLLPPLFRREETPPEGTGFSSGSLPVRADGVKLLLDETGYDAERGARVVRQEIFDQMLSAIASAQRMIFADFFLWNAWQGPVPEEHRRLCDELADALIRRKGELPELAVVVVTDPINRMYGAGVPEPFARMREAGIVTVFTDTDRLRDSNRIYSPYARFYGGLLRRLPGVRSVLNRVWMPNPLYARGGRFSAAQWGRLLFFKANHRKVLICDTEDGAGLTLIAGSLNPADGSSAHSNVGLQVDGALAAAALLNEWAIPGWSSGGPGNPECCGEGLAALRERMCALAEAVLEKERSADEPIQGEWLTEDAIREKILELLEGAGEGDAVRIGLFYLSDRGVMGALCTAVEAGASVRLLLDPNRDAFGRTKNGIPNRPAAAELLERTRGAKGTLTIRWADTHGEQYHAKAMSISNPEKGRWFFLAGSANWTRRNLAGFNLEADVYLENARGVQERFNAYFDRLWHSAGPVVWSAPYEAYAESGFSARWKRWLYRFQEGTGAGTF